MAKQIIWSLRAQTDKESILDYWTNRNKSNNYSKRLNQIFKESISIIAEHPKLGRPTEFEFVRIKVVRDYLIVYEESKSHIAILAIWDNRQNPNELRKRLI